MVKKERFDRSDIRKLNAISVLNQLRRQGELSRAQIASQLGLTRATVSSIVLDLIESGLVKETEYTEGVTGRPGLLLKLNPQCGCMVGVEIDLDRISVMVANLGQEVIWESEKGIEVGIRPEKCLAVAAQMVRTGLSKGKSAGLNCFGICVGWAGLVNRDAGELSYGPTFGWEHVPLKASWEKQFEVPVFVENEAHAGAMGVFHFGKTEGALNLIYLSVGYGLAAGVFMDGILLRGQHGYAGQVGHSSFADNQIVCGCGKTGCWVTEVGARAVLRKINDIGLKLPSTDGMDIVKSIEELLQTGDARVKRILESVGRQIGRGLAPLVQTFDPSQVIIGGRLGRLLKHAEPAIRKGWAEEVLPHMSESLQITVSDNPEDQLMGCLAIVFDAVMKNPPIGPKTQ